MTKLPCDTPEETTAFVNSLPISEEKPWIMQNSEKNTVPQHRQRWRKTTLLLQVIRFQVNYENVDQPDILQW